MLSCHLDFADEQRRRRTTRFDQTQPVVGCVGWRRCAADGDAENHSSSSWPSVHHTKPPRNRGSQLSRLRNDYYKTRFVFVFTANCRWLLRQPLWCHGGGTFNFRGLAVLYHGDLSREKYDCRTRKFDLWGARGTTCRWFPAAHATSTPVPQSNSRPPNLFPPTASQPHFPCFDCRAI